MSMKRILIPLSAVFLLFSCDKPAEKIQSTLTVSVTEIGSRTATVSVGFEGATPSLVRLTAPLLKEDFPTGEQEQSEFIKTKGAAITLPYSGALKDLFPSNDYLIGAISFDENLDVLAWTTAEFRTEDLGTTTVGDPSGAGTLTGNGLEDKPEEEEGEE